MGLLIFPLFGSDFAPQSKQTDSTGGDSHYDVDNSLSHLLDVTDFFQSASESQKTELTLPQKFTTSHAENLLLGANSHSSSLRPSILSAQVAAPSPPLYSRQRISSNPRSKVIGVRNVEVVDYSIQDCDGKNYVLYRMNVQTDGNHWTIRRRYNDFTDLHYILCREMPPSLTCELALPPRRFIKRRKFDPVYLEKRADALDGYMKYIMRLPELADCSIVREFLSDQWCKPKRKKTHIQSIPILDMPSIVEGKYSNIAVVASHKMLTPRQLKRLVARTQQPSANAAPISKGKYNEISESTTPKTHKRSGKGICVFTKPSVPRLKILQRELEFQRKTVGLSGGTPPRPKSEYTEQYLSDVSYPERLGDATYPTKKRVLKQRNLLKEKGKVGKTSLIHVTNGYSSSEADDN